MGSSVYSTPVPAHGVLYIVNRNELFALAEGARIEVVRCVSAGGDARDHSIAISDSLAAAVLGVCAGSSSRLDAVPGSSPLLGTTDATLPPTLKLLWTYDAGDAIESSAAIADGVVYVGSQTGELHAVNLSDGSLKWKYKASP